MDDKLCFGFGIEIFIDEIFVRLMVFLYFHQFVLCVSLLAGREQVSSLVENAITGNSMGTLIRAPSGCGEQNMIGMTLPVIATIYLDKTNQWEAVGFHRRNEALQHIKTGTVSSYKWKQKMSSS